MLYAFLQLRRAAKAEDDAAMSLPNELFVSIGCRIMLQNNLWTERGLVNGAFATLRDFHVNLAYAITVHKSQGVTLDRAVVDITDQSYEFSTGLRYVGVSRVRSLRGVVFQKTFALDDLQTSSTAATMEARLDDREKRLP
ncbi:hypothetical protein N7535_007395 [Penicillium sp. DV-2018c]|nr:hypothetical protein N7535_007395 [Penicillium sp. DV-2018c]